MSFRSILILIFIYALFNFIVKVVLPFAARAFVNKAHRDMQERMRQMEEQQRKPEGEISITKKSNKRDDGDYVDYEEVD